MLSSPVMKFKSSVGLFFTVSFISYPYSTLLLILGQHFRHKLRCNPMHVQLFCANWLAKSINNSKLCTEFGYGMTAILEDSSICLFHFCAVYDRVCPTWRTIINGQNSGILKTSKPLECLAKAHARITKRLLQTFRSFTLRFIKSNTEIDTQNFNVNSRHTAYITK